MSKPPVKVVLSRIKPLAPEHQAAHLRALIANEPKRSLRQHDLRMALKSIVDNALGRAKVERRKRRRVLVA